MQIDLLPGLISGSPVYISGPIGDFIGGQRSAPIAALVEGILVASGYPCYNPFGSCLHIRNFEIPKSIWLEHDEYWIRHCKAIVLLPGWQDSEGANYEIDFARRILPDVMIYEWLPTADNLGRFIILEWSKA